MKNHNDRVIKIKYAASYILKHFIVLIVCAVCGAIALSGLCYLKNRNEMNNTNDLAVETENIYETLSDTEKVDVAYALYCYDEQQDLEEYLHNSLYMKIKPYHVQQSTYQFRVQLSKEPESQEECVKLQNQIIAAYNWYIRNGGLANDIEEKATFKADYTAQQLKELLDVGYDGTLDANGSICLYVNGTDLVSGLDEIACETLINKGKSFQNLSPHKLVIVNKQNTIIRNDTIYNNQKTTYNETTAASDRLENAVDSLTDNALTYYKDMVAEEQEESIQEVNVVQNIKNKLLKYGLIGGILGACGGAVLLLLVYMYSKVVISDTDYTLTMGVKLFGHVSASNPLEQMGFSVAKIIAVCKKRDITQIALISSNMDLIEENVQNTLKEMLEKQNVELEIMSNVVTDSEEMGKLFELQNAVVIEKKGTSLYQRVYDIIDLCEDNEVSILGLIDVQK